MDEIRQPNRQNKRRTETRYYRPLTTYEASREAVEALGSKGGLEKWKEPLPGLRKNDARGSVRDCPQPNS